MTFRIWRNYNDSMSTATAKYERIATVELDTSDTERALHHYLAEREAAGTPIDYGLEYAVQREPQDGLLARMELFKTVRPKQSYVLKRI